MLIPLLSPPPAHSRNSEELPLVGATHGVVGCHLVPFGYLLLYAPEEVGEGVAEVLYPPLYGLRSPGFSAFGVGVVADRWRETGRSGSNCQG